MADIFVCDDINLGSHRKHIPSFVGVVSVAAALSDPQWVGESGDQFPGPHL